MPPLFDAITAPDNLASAWDRVCRKNKAGGVDGQSVADFAASADAHIADLRADLLAERFVPLPNRTVHIPKGRHETRRLSLPTVRDKVVQEAIRRVTSPLLDRIFLNVSYAYRPDRGVRRATGRLLHILRQHKPAAVIRSDIDDFFDTIDHERLLARFDATLAAPRVTRLIRLFLEAGTIARGGRHEELDLGVPTGSVLAPDLSNLYLHDLDAWLLDRLGPRDGYVRYADDYVVLVDTPARAEALHAESAAFLRDTLHLRLNPDKLALTTTAAGFTFLGVFHRHGRLRLDRDKLQKINSRLTNWADRAAQWSPGFARDRLAERVEGWRRYYGRGELERDLHLIDVAIGHATGRVLRAWRDAGKLAGTPSHNLVLNHIPRLSREGADPRPAASREAFEGKSTTAHPKTTEPPPASEPKETARSRAGVSPTDQTPGRASEPTAASRSRAGAPPTASETAPEPTETSRSRAAAPPTASEPTAAARSRAGAPPTAPEAATEAAPAGEPTPAPVATAPTETATAAETAPASPPARPGELTETQRRHLHGKRRNIERDLATKSELVVTKRGSHLALSKGQIVVRRDRKIIHRQQLSRVRAVMLQGSGITVTTNLLTELLDADVGVFLADDRGRPAAILHAADGVRAERMAEQAEAVFGKRGARIARKIVRGKLRNQRNLLRTRLDYQRESDPATAATLEAAIAGVEQAEAKLKALPKATGPLTREDRDVLMGFEGVAARHYWDGVKALVADDAIFPGRRYPNAEDAVNCALNYGYGILYQRVERAILTSGLSPRLGMLHAPRRKANALTYDMVEEYRAYFVDRAVLAMVTRGEPMAVDRRGRLTDDTRRLVARNVLERVNLPTVYRSQRLILEEILGEQLQLLTKAFIGEEPYRAFIGRW